jgi:hypothetical protein
MKKGFALLLLAIILVVSAITPIIAQDFAFGGAGNTGNGFRNSVFIPTPLANRGVTGASRTPSPIGTLLAGYLNNITNTGANRLPNGNSVSFNATDVGIFDMDADGFPDLVAISDDSNVTQINAPLIPAGVLAAGQTGRITLFTGAGDGTFGLPVSAPVNTALAAAGGVVGPTCLVIGDVNLDGLGDAIVGTGDDSLFGGIQAFSGGTLSTASNILQPRGGIGGAPASPNSVSLSGFLGIGANANNVVSLDLERLNEEPFPDLIVGTTNF